MSQFLFVGSTEPYSGKSAAILGLAYHLRQQGMRVAYGKPISSCLEDQCGEDGADLDTKFISEALDLNPKDIPPIVLQLNEANLFKQMADPEAKTYAERLQDYHSYTQADLVLLEGPGDLHEGELFHLSLLEMAETLNADVLLLCRYHSALVVEALLGARRKLQDRLAGVLLNDVKTDQQDQVEASIVPFLEAQGIPVLGILPSNRILRSIGVGELAKELEAEVLCCVDRLDSMVEDFAVGAMNVNSALKYFRKSEHKAVITGGDRTDIQLAALETSTLCLILTGKHPLDPQIKNRAEDLEVPILSVDLDTFSTIERIERVFGQVRLHETVKVRSIQDLMSRNFDFPRFYRRIGQTQPLASASAS